MISCKVMWKHEQEDFDLPVHRQGSFGDREADRSERVKVAENALIEAIGRLTGTKPATGLQPSASIS